jgi:Xaa-Pro aminopeptidase
VVGGIGRENPEETIFSIGRDAAIPHNTGNPQDVLRTGQPIVFDISRARKAEDTFTIYPHLVPWICSAGMQDMHQQHWKFHHSIIAALQPNTPFKVYQDMACDMFERWAMQPSASNTIYPKANPQHRTWFGLDIHEIHSAE